MTFDVTKLRLRYTSNRYQPTLITNIVLTYLFGCLIKCENKENTVKLQKCSFSDIDDITGIIVLFPLSYGSIFLN